MLDITALQAQWKAVRTDYDAIKAEISNIYRQRFLLPFQILDLLGDRVFRANTLR